MSKRKSTVSLTTPFAKDLEGVEIPYDVYPRPAFRRDSFLCLNGSWELSVERDGVKKSLGKILVPFPPESALSGIERITGKGDILHYSRTFSLPEGFQKERVLLHFGAVDQLAQVEVNGTRVCTHQGGYLPFSADITRALIPGENTLTVRVVDELDRKIPYGKQSKKPGGMWYTPVSGIWQTVWLESVPKNAVEAIDITADLQGATVRVTGGEEKKKLILSGEGFSREYRFDGDSLRIELPDGRHWTPETPYLYRVTLFSGEDRVESYFALRKIDLQKRGGVPLICLNGEPYHFHGVLDQGYFPDGIYLPASPRGYTEDILQMKAHGFNMLRKHIKVEPAVFYYECDRLGMAVFQDFVSNGSYSFLRDTALPTLGIQKGIRVKRGNETKSNFLQTALATQKLLAPYPSVLLYTVFNEGWGQFDADKLYHVFKKSDPSRLYDATSGWFREKESDVDSRHIYFKRLKLPTGGDKPLFLSEFGGYACRIEGHSFLEKGEYGYRFFKKASEWEDAVIDLYESRVLPLAEKGLCATVLTQLSDVEEETNGLLTYDRIPKGDPARFAKAAKKIRAAFENFVNGLEKDETL